MAGGWNMTGMADGRGGNIRFTSCNCFDFGYFRARFDETLYLSCWNRENGGPFLLHFDED